MSSGVFAGGMGFVYAAAGKRYEALKIIDQFRSVSESRYVDAYVVAAIYAGLSDKNRALDWLNKGVEERSASMVFLKVDPFFDSLHSDPRFQKPAAPDRTAAVIPCSALTLPFMPT